ncbi:hypothetical protein GUJ93_ZPchr0009g307 [Zizania palustris]|uniref:C2 domain-containing protein n=1 Tax=Zizania palustris TaxID=103762 RepID=A0A8J5UYV4_ZIZPA|nr:hypothetical protein GUJ93_ZPchr0009g307 [Zizania palustris]
MVAPSGGGVGLPVVHVNDSDHPLRETAGGQAVVAMKSLSPVWDDESSFLVGDVAKELVVSVLSDDRYFNNDLLRKPRCLL